MIRVLRGIVQAVLVSTFIAEVMSEATNNFLGNILSGMIPSGWAKSPLVPIITIIVLVLFQLWQKSSEKRIDLNQSHSSSQGTASSTHIHLHYNNYPATMSTNAPVQASLPSASPTANALNPAILSATAEVSVTPTLNASWQTKTPRQGSAASKAILAGLPPFPMERRYSRELPEQPQMVYWSPDGTYLAALFYGSAPYLINKQHKPLPEWGEVQALCWSPDGNTLAISTDGTIHFWDIVHARESAPALHLSTRSLYSLDWSILGELGVWVDDQIQIFTFPAQRASYTLSTQGMRSQSIGQLRWSPDGAWLAAGSRKKHEQGSLLYWSRESKISRWLASSPGVEHMAWKPGSTQLAVIFRNRHIGIWDIATDQQLPAPGPLPVTPHSISISRDDYLVAALLEDEIYIQQLTSPFATSKYPGHKIAVWSPTGPELAILDGQTNMLHICAPPPGS